jgi:hypothetical protein
VSHLVNRTANDNPKLLERIVPGEAKPRLAPPHPRPKRPKPDDGQGALF